MDDTGDGRWLTYAELAQIRGINRASAVKLVQRERWQRSSGNDRARTVRVLVPEDWLQPAKERPPSSGDRSDGSVEYAGMLAAIEGAHAGETAALRGEIAALKTVETGLREQLAQAGARADRAEEASRKAEEAAELLRRAEVERQARGLLARLRAALRGG